MMRRAFTLVELLVVLTIIVVLMSLLTPSMDKALGAARSAVCMSNLHVWTHGMRLYSMDHKGKVIYIPRLPPRGTYWFHSLARYVGSPGYDPTPWQADPWAGMLKVNYCGETAHVNIPDGFGSARLTWGAHTAQGSYGWNLWMASDYFTVDALGNERDNRFPVEDFYSRFSDAPGDAPVLGDSNWIGSWPDDIDIVPADREYPYSPHESGYFMSRFAVERHGLSVNMGFVDGSARNVKLWDLWKLRWHKNFVGASRDPAEFRDP